MEQGIIQLYKMRNRFIIIGVTGKTGSGCTTVAEIFSKEKHNVENIDAFYEGKETKREWYALKSFYDKHWKAFYHIRVKDIISTFILESSYDEAEKYIKDNFDIDISGFKSRYELFFEKNKILDSFLIDSNALLYTPKSKEEKEEVEKEREKIKDYILYEIQGFTDEFKMFLNGYDGKYTKVYQAIRDNIRKKWLRF